MKSQFDKIKEAISKDIEIDENALDDSARNQSKKYIKYLNIYNTLRMKWYSLESEHKKLCANKYYFYKNEYEIIPKNAAEINLFLDGDDEVIASAKVLFEVSEQMEYLESVLKIISTQGFAIKNMIDWRKFINGGM